MSRSGFAAEQIIPELREAEVELVHGGTVGQVCKKIGVTEQSYYRWCKDYEITAVCTSKVKHSVGSLRDNGWSIQTCNFYLQAMKRFFKWMVRDRCTGQSPVEHL